MATLVFPVGTRVRHTRVGDTGTVRRIDRTGRMWVEYDRMGFGTGKPIRDFKRVRKE